MRCTRLVCLLLACLARLAAQTPDVGSGPVSAATRQEFVRSYFRNGFHILVSLPPLGDVRRFGPTGLVQEFPDAAKTKDVTYALVKANTLDTFVEGVETVLQVYPRIYSYYTSLGVSTVGYPITDSMNCPPLTSSSCQYQLFDKNYALFVYASPLITGQNFSLKDPFFSRWRTLGGAGALGAVVAAEETAPSGAGTGVTATAQRFTAGALYNITSGAFSGRMFAVTRPIYDLYTERNAHTGFLGLPLSDEVALPNDRFRQNFEGGAVEYERGSLPVLRLPVASVSVSADMAADRLNLGDTVTLRATTFAANGALLEGRSIAWVSSNSRVVTVDSSGSTVTARAVGGGTATITAISEGKSSRAVTFFVVAPCCQVGEGAPTPAIQQMFQDAISRNRLAVKLPAAAPVRRVGDGYVQELVAADEVTRLLLAKPDSAAVAYLVTGAILARYLELGGAAGSLGYPRTDASPAGRQLFEAGALAGNPVFLVSGPVLSRWAAQNYENGPAGLPAGPSESVLSFAGTLGVRQPFSGGPLLAHLTGALAGRAFLVTGLIAVKYAELAGPLGSFGLPASDEAVAGGRRRQDFEGGTIELAPGAAEATAVERERRPSISATPSNVAAGSRVRIAAGGFATGATLRISVSGQPDFVVQTQTGAYAWEVFVPAGARSGLVTLRAADINGAAIAVGSYLVQSAAETLAKVTKLRGDLQVGLPGARLPQPLRISVKDEFGNALVGIPVRFTASPGAQIEAASPVTDERGEAQAFLRLPLQELPALATAEAGRQVVTFSSRAAASTLANFPRFTHSNSLLAAAASILRHLQNTGQLAAPSGPAEPAALDLFLRDFCVFDPRGERLCDGYLSAPGSSAKHVNLWRLGSFTGGLDVAAAGTSPESIRDLMAQGVPVLLALAASTGQETRPHFVVAIGAGSNGAILIHDPNSAWNRPGLEHYLGGFSSGGEDLKATVATAIQLIPRTSSALGFLVTTTSTAPRIASAGGSCGFAAAWPDAVGSAQAPTMVRFHYCDGLDPAYQLDLPDPGQHSFAVTTLGSPGARSETTASAPSAFGINRPSAVWEVTLQQLAFEASSVVNAATFQPDLSPGVLAAIFGSGMAVPGAETIVEIGGQRATVVSATPFQVNAQLPVGLPPGRHAVRVRSPFGAAEQLIELVPVSPALFSLAGGRAAILNQDGTLNSPANPARRGQVVVVYGTGLGAVSEQARLLVAQAPVTGLLEGQPLQTLFAGLAPGLPGVYQMNLLLPENLPPGLDLRLTVRQANRASNPVLIAVQ